MEQNVVKSAARVIHVLEFFDEVRRSSTVAEVADHHGWPHSSTSVLMRSLVALGYLHYDPNNRTYLPSMRVALLGDWIQDSLFSNGQLMNLMQHLNEETGETIVLAAQNALHSQYLRVIQGTNTLRMHLHIGTLRPLLGSGTGRMLLTGMDDANIRKLVRKYNASADVQPRVDVTKLLEQIAADRAKGYAMSINQVTPHATLIAMLLPTRSGEKALTIGVAGLSDRVLANADRYVEAMRQAIKIFVAPDAH
jgi:IclR family acetate operon transcriptional repressor